MESVEMETTKSFLEYPVVKSFLAGSISGTLSTVVFQPLDLVKTRLQTPVAMNIEASRGLGMIPILTQIVQNEQFSGLWRGITPSLVRCVPGVGLYFSSLHCLKSQLLDKKRIKKLNSIECVGLGVTARSISGVCLIPFTVLKTRFESGVYRYTNMSNAIKVIYRSEGTKGFVCGLVPTLLRDAPFSGLYLLFYTQTKQQMPEEWFHGNLSSPLHFSCGIMAGLLASVVTQPADVIKTKMQLYPDKYGTLLLATQKIYQKCGASGYFKGLVPRMLRRTLMAAMAWTLYERISLNLGLK